LESQEIATNKNYFSWLISQLKGWPIQNYMLYFFSFGFQLALFIGGPITLDTTLTFIGTTLGVLCILSINAAKSVNGWLGLLSAICFIYVGWHAKNYLSILEQISYVVTLDLPVIFAVKTWNNETVHKLRKFGNKEWVIALVSTLLVYLLSGWAIGAFTNDPRPWFDAFAFAVSLTAGVMCFLRYNNNFIWWLVSGIAQLILWAVTFSQGDATIAMAVNASIYVINDILAFTVSPWFNHGRKRLGLERIE